MANILEPIEKALAELEKRVQKLESAKPKKVARPKDPKPPEETKTASIRVPWGKKER